MTDEIRTFTQSEVDSIIGKVRIEARDRAEREIRDELEASERNKEIISKLEEQVETYRTKYLGIMQATFDTMVSELSEDVKEMVGDLPGDLSDKIAWLQTHKDALKTKPTGDGVGNRSANPSENSAPKSAYHRRGARK